MAKKGRPQQSPGGQRRASADRKAAAAKLLEERRRRDRRQALLIQGAIALVVVLVVVATTVALLRRSDSSNTSGATPPGLTKDGAVRFGAAQAPVTVQAVEDFQCPVCKQFEATNGSLLAQYRAGDQVAVEYRPIAFLDRSSSTEYSTRALNASMCVLEDAGKDAWLKYHGALYANQPEEGTAGLPDSQLLSMAKSAGATGSGVSGCISDRRYGGWAKRTTQAAFDDGVSGTPTLFVNGKKLSGFDTASLTKAVKEAAGS